jgi:hypothetical protein
VLAVAQAARAVVDAIAGGLPRVGFDGDDAWARLLGVPLDPRSSGLQAALDHLAAADVPPPEAAAATRALRASLAGRGEQTARAPAPGAGGASDATHKLSRPSGGASAPRPATQPQLSAAATTPRSAAAAWQQRAAAAGVEEAFFAPLHARSRPRTTSPAPAAAGTLQPALAPASPWPPQGTVATAAAYTTTPPGQPPGQPPGGPAPVLPRLNSALDRIDRRMASAPAEHLRPAPYPTGHGAGAHAAGAVELPRGRNPGADAPGTAARPASPQHNAIAQGLNAPAVAAHGFRGLAARAAAATPSSLPTLPAAATESAGLAAPDDEQLAEQLARVLRREAERDGIDTRDVAP